MAGATAILLLTRVWARGGHSPPSFIDLFIHPPPHKMLSEYLTCTSLSVRTIKLSTNRNLG